MSNTVKIKNKKKKKELKVNYKLWAIVFGVFVAVIVGLAVWASFHWGVGMGTIGVRPVSPEEVDMGATESAAEFATDAMVLTPEQMEEMGIVVDGAESADAVEETADPEAEGAAEETAGAEAEGAAEETAGAEAEGAAEETAGAEAEGAAEETAGQETEGAGAAQ